MSSYLSRLTLNNAASACALRPLLNPDNPSLAADVHHRLIWSVMSDSHARKRDFLWRHDGKGRFMVLSARPPKASDLFLPPETKAFEPDLQRGDRLVFLLCANATRSKKTGRARGQRSDVVMDLLHGLAREDRAGARQGLAEKAGIAWMEVQGQTRGFRPVRTQVEGYTVLDLARRNNRRASLGILDLKGEIEITDPATFLPALVQGFGRAKAWGNGLMLIRRAP